MGVAQAKENRTGRAEQLSLLRSKELAKLQCPSSRRFPGKGEVQTSDTAGARRARRTKGGAIQDKLPGF
jgi:hypothetical protein